MLQRGPVDPKFQVEGVAPTNHSSSQKTTLNDLSYGIKIIKDISSVLSQWTRLTDRQTDGRQTDRRTDRILVARPRLHCIQRGKKSWAANRAWQENISFISFVYITPARLVGGGRVPCSAEGVADRSIRSRPIYRHATVSSARLLL